MIGVGFRIGFHKPWRELVVRGFLSVAISKVGAAKNMTDLNCAASKRTCPTHFSLSMSGETFVQTYKSTFRVPDWVPVGRESTN
jgi:hypothetical protein